MKHSVDRNRESNKQADIQITDLLGREIIPIQVEEASWLLKDQVILVTGAAGSIGSELCRQLLNYEPELLIALDTNETGLFDLVESLRSHKHISHFHPHLADITDKKNIGRLLGEKRPHILFHAAAYKHVPLLEQHPEQAIRTNVLATYYLCLLAQEYNVARFIFVSSDKAADPISVMGATKRVGEMIIQSLAQLPGCETRFCAVRFGNVIGSRGSVVPIFLQQISQGGPVTVTDPNATRYFMTIPEACGLVILAAGLANQGDLYLLDMGDPVRIIDLAVKMISFYGYNIGQDISIVYTGLRPGERLHEMLVAAGENLLSTPYRKIFSVVHPENITSFSSITQWLYTLENYLLEEGDYSQLRDLLFKIIQNNVVLIH